MTTPSERTIPLAAIALGACFIEKRYRPSTSEMEGWDHGISSDPPVLRAVVEEGRIIHEALGSTRRMLSEDPRDRQAPSGSGAAW